MGGPHLPVKLRKKRQREKDRKSSLFQKLKKTLQNFDIKDILEQLNVHSKSYFVSNLSIFTG
jgi:hypothetical protein